MAKRFASHTDDEIIKKRAKNIPDNTQKANKKAANILRAYLQEKQQEDDFENFDVLKLNEVLSHFYLDARKTDGENAKPRHRLWQRPLDSFVETSDVWYCNRAVGKDTLGKFMPELIRTTGVTILTKRNFSAAQIMSLTGHGSVSSLAIYHRVSDDEKVQMDQAIISAIRGPNKMPALPSSSSSTSFGLELSNLPAIQTKVLPLMVTKKGKNSKNSMTSTWMNYLTNFRMKTPFKKT
ncbi:hypothetical protein KUTeg_001301 [Tegillarca granosa]|uniref:Tyr recombinase domain-containing protein n=1 Tax=Tegillarca granosa TaxID=220873 RepID=A0ABQ9FYJ9_TEGGR|nr:hypothetical protein KUTeg_001301 [Tegillarca granosa]